MSVLQTPLFGDTRTAQRAGDGTFTISSGTSLTVGDFEVIESWADSGTQSITTNGGTPGTAWTALPGSPFSGPGSEKLYVWTRIIASGDDGGTVITAASSAVGTAIHKATLYTICADTFDPTTPIDAIGTVNSGTSTTATLGSVTTVTNGAKLLAIVGGGAAFGSNAITQTGQTYIERFDDISTTGDDGKLSMADSTKTTAGATSAGTIALAGSMPWICLPLAIRPNNLAGNTTHASWAAAMSADAPRNRYDFDDTTGTTSTDSGSTPTNGTYVGSPTLGSAKVIENGLGTAVTMLGTDEEMTAAVTLSGSAWTIEQWIDDWSSGNDILLRDNTGTSGTIPFWITAGSFQSRINNVTIDPNPSVTSPKDGARHYMVVERLGAGLSGTRLWLDGKLIASGTVANFTSSSPLHFGKNGTNSAFATYRQDVAAIYTVGLGGAKVVAHYEAGLKAATIEERALGTFADNAGTYRITTTGPAPVGSKIFVTAQIWGSVTSLADSAGNTYTKIVDQDASSGRRTTIWAATCTTTLPTGGTITATTPGAGDIIMSGVAVVGLDNSATSQSDSDTGSTTAWSTGPINRTFAKSFIIAASATDANTTSAPDAGTELVDAVVAARTHAVAQYRITTSLGNESEGGTRGTAGNWSAAVVVWPGVPTLQTISPGKPASASQAFGPDLDNVTAQTLSPGAASSTAQAYGPTLENQNGINPGLATSTPQAFGPEVDNIAGQDLEVGRATSPAQAFGPDVENEVVEVYNLSAPLTFDADQVIEFTTGTLEGLLEDVRLSLYVTADHPLAWQSSSHNIDNFRADLESPNDDEEWIGLKPFSNGGDFNPWGDSFGEGAPGVTRETETTYPIEDVSEVSVPFDFTGEPGTTGGIEVEFYVTHTYVSDLEIYLEDPDGNRALLYNQRGNGNQDLGISQSQPMRIQRYGGDLSAGFNDPPYADQPYAADGGNLDTHFGKPVSGVWNLVFSDVVGGDVGTVEWAKVMLTPRTIAGAQLVVFTDDATLRISDQQNPPYVGPYLPDDDPHDWLDPPKENRFRDLFTGINPQGTWRLYVFWDGGFGSTVTIQAAKLELIGVTETGPPAQSVFPGRANSTPVAFGPELTNTLQESEPPPESEESEPASPNVGIPDEGSYIYEWDIVAEGLAEDIAVGVWIEHPNVSDLVITLESPQGTQVSLLNQRGGNRVDLGAGSGSNELMYFYIGAPDGSVSTIPDNGFVYTVPIIGSFIPEGNLFQFINEPLEGTWKLIVEDVVTGNVGTLKAANFYYTVGALPLPPDILRGPFPFGVPPIASHMEWEITGLLRPQPGSFFLGVLPDSVASSSPILYAYDGKVTIRSNSERQAEVKVPAIPELQRVLMCALDASRYMLRCYLINGPSADDRNCIFWGQMTKPTIDSGEDFIVLNALDQGLRLREHQVRLGDQALNKRDHLTLPNPYHRRVPVNGDGYRMLFDAAQNLEGNQQDNDPPLGVNYNFDDSEPLPVNTDLAMKFERGDPVLNCIKDLSEHQTAPDFELNPGDPSRIIQGVYVDLNIYQHQGDYDATLERSYYEAWAGGPGGCAFEGGFGKDNCRVVHQPGGKLYSHVHVLSAEGRKRITRHDQDSAEAYGIFVYWQPTNYKTKNVGLLRFRGDQILDAYSRPPDYFSVTLNKGCEYVYLRHFIIGTTVRAAYRKNGLGKAMLGRISQVILTQSDSAGNVETEITVLPKVGAAYTDDITEET